jgi:hypothetical protein
VLRIAASTRLTRSDGRPASPSPTRAVPVSPTRRARLARIRALKAKGRTSTQIGRELDLAPSTVRDYLNDPYRQKARKRQRTYGVEGVTMPSGGTEITEVRPSAKFTPHKGKGREHNLARGRQVRAIIGWAAHR